MGKHLRIFNTTNEFLLNEGEMVSPWVVYIRDKHNGETSNAVDEVKYKQIRLTVAECIEEGFFNSPVSVDDCYLITTAKVFPYPVKCITDFVDVFFGTNDLSGGTASKVYSFSLGSKDHMTAEQQEYIVDKLAEVELARGLSAFKLRNFTLPDKDLIVNQSSAKYYDYQYSHDMLSGSTFRDIQIGIYGNISSAWHLLRNITCNSIEFKVNGTLDGSYTVRPYNNKGEMYQGSKMNRLPRNISYYGGGSNWIFAGLSLNNTEIPCVGGVETEEQRISMNKNEITLASGTQYQICMYLDKLTKIGPVFNALQVNGYEYLWGRCAIHLLNVTDVRFKNINNMDYDFSSTGTNKVYIPKMDLASMKYIVENARSQAEWLYTNHVSNSTSGAVLSVSASNSHLLYHNPLSRTDDNNAYSAVMFSGSKFKATVPSGFNLLINGYKKSGSNYYATGEQLSIVGDGTEQTVAFTNSESAYAVFMITKTNGDTITPSSLIDYSLAISRVTSTDSDGNDVYSNYMIPSHRHICKFPDGIYSASEVQEYLDGDGNGLIHSAYNKGWTIYVGNTKLTFPV